MNSDVTKAALRNLINLTIKGDPDNQAASVVHDVLQAKMQAHISPQQEQPADDAEQSAE